jgi:glycine cleavage system H protein
MKALPRPLSDVLITAGCFALVLLALPALAVGAFLIRAVFFVALPVAVVTGATFWFTSARFRSWFGAATSPVATYKGLRLATDVALDGGHAWTRVEGANVTVGADDLLTSALGPADRVDLPAPGRQVSRGDVLFRLTRGDRDLEILAPIGGTVVAANDALRQEPGLVNADPFRRGWAVRLRGAPESGRDREGLRRGPEALVWFRTEVDRLFATVLGDVAAAPAMADGGVVAGDLHARIDNAAWLRVKATLGGSRS